MTNSFIITKNFIKRKLAEFIYLEWDKLFSETLDKAFKRLTGIVDTAQTKIIGIRKMIYEGFNYNVVKMVFALALCKISQFSKGG